MLEEERRGRGQWVQLPHSLSFRPGGGSGGWNEREVEARRTNMPYPCAMPDVWHVRGAPAPAVGYQVASCSRAGCSDAAAGRRRSEGAPLHRCEDSFRRDGAVCGVVFSCVRVHEYVPELVLLRACLPCRVCKRVLLGDPTDLVLPGACSCR